MANIFNTEPAVFFVGGTGDKTGSDYAGGCTEAWLIAKGNNFTLSNIMGNHGSPLVALNDTVTWGGIVDYTATGPAGAFAAVEIGMVVYVSGLGTSDRFKITNKFSDTQIEIAGLSDAPGTFSVFNVGGAFPILQTLVGNMDAAYYRQTIFTNKDETGLTTRVVDWGLTVNYEIRVVGFKTTIWDRCYGGQYYKDSVNGYVVWQQDSGTTLFNQERDNLRIENISLSQSAACISYMMTNANAVRGTVFWNCKFDKANNGMPWLFYTGLSGCKTRFFDCEISASNLNGYIIQHYGETHFWRCKFRIYGQNTVSLFLGAAPTSANLRDCIIEIDNVALTNIFYSTAKPCVNMVNTSLVLIGTGTLTYIADTVGYAILVNDSILRSAGDLFNPATNPVNSLFRDFCGYNCVPDAVSRSYPGDVQSDPLYADAANGDYRLLYGSPCLNTGRPVPGGLTQSLNGYNSMGAWQRKSLLEI
jgi:hypothetical protein